MTSATSSRIDGNLIAVDTSTALGSLALANYSNQVPQIKGEKIWNKLAMHSEVATLELQNLLNETNTRLDEVAYFAVNVGPGSFTGLRVGINLIRTLAYSLDKPVAMFTSLEVLAFENAKPGEKILVAIKAIQNFYYAAAYQKTGAGMKTLVQPFSANLDEVRALGSFDRTFIEGENSLTASQGARSLVQMCATAQFFSWKIVKPLYVRASEAEEKLKKGILKPLA